MQAAAASLYLHCRQARLPLSLADFLQNIQSDADKLPAVYTDLCKIVKQQDPLSIIL